MLFQKPLAFGRFIFILRHCPSRKNYFKIKIDPMASIKFGIIIFFLFYATLLLTFSTKGMNVPIFCIFSSQALTLCSLLDTCQKENILTAKVKVFVNCTTLHAFKNCVSNLKQLACHLYHPVCFAQNHTITSPVCREACNNNMQRSCSSVQHSFFEVIKLMIDYCPAETVDFDQPFRLLEDCGNFPPVDMKYIHRCQLISCK